MVDWRVRGILRLYGYFLVILFILVVLGCS